MVRRNEILRGREHLPNGRVNARRGFRVNRVVVPRTGTINQCFVPRVRSENHLLKPVADDLVVTRQQEDRRGMDSSGVGDAVQFVRNPPRERNRQEPEIPRLFQGWCQTQELALSPLAYEERRMP